MLYVYFYCQSHLFGIETGIQVDELHSVTLYRNVSGCKCSAFFDDDNVLRLLVYFVS